MHLAAESALDACRDGRQRDLPVYVETRPLYLHLTAERFEEPDGAKYAGAPAPPLGRRTAPRCGPVSASATSTSSPPTTPPGGWPTSWTRSWTRPTCGRGLPTWRRRCRCCGPKASGAGRLTPERFVAVTATNPARLFGLSPRKGTIAVGADADVVVFDPEATRIVDGATMHSNADYSPYDGWEVTGWPAVTVSRGEVVAVGSDVRTVAGRGRPAVRGRHQPL